MTRGRRSTIKPKLRSIKSFIRNPLNRNISEIQSTLKHQRSVSQASVHIRRVALENIFPITPSWHIFQFDGDKKANIIFNFHPHVGLRWEMCQIDGIRDTLRRKHGFQNPSASHNYFPEIFIRCSCDKKGEEIRFTRCGTNSDGELK